MTVCGMTLWRPHQNHENQDDLSSLLSFSACLDPTDPFCDATYFESDSRFNCFEIGGSDVYPRQHAGASYWLGRPGPCRLRFGAALALRTVRPAGGIVITLVKIRVFISRGSPGASRLGQRKEKFPPREFDLGARELGDGDQGALRREVVLKYARSNKTTMITGRRVVVHVMYSSLQIGAIPVNGFHSHLTFSVGM